MAVWPQWVEAKAAKLARRYLRDVWCLPDHHKYGQIAYHLRRRLTGAELKSLSAAWLALPAVDMA